MEEEMLKVIGLNLTFFTRCLKKSAWHERCSCAWRALVRSWGAFLTITIFVLLMKFPGLFLTLPRMQLGGAAAHAGMQSSRRAARLHFCV